MEQKEEFVLIEGSFEAADAKNILLNLWSSKIRYHEMKSFGSQERLGRKDVHSEERIEALKKSRENILIILDQATLHDKRLIIDSTVKIRIQS